MKLIVLRNNLKSGLSAVERAVTENSALPILKNVLIKTFNNRIKLVGTNLELGISCLVSGKIIEEGEVNVPFGVLYGIINNIDSEKVSLESEKNNLHIKTDNYNAVIQGVSSEEFPIIPKIENTEYNLELNGEVLKNSLLKVSSSVQISEIRPEISGVLFDFQITILKIAATDSFRLSEVTLINNQYTTNLRKGFKVIIPLKTIQELIRIIPDDKQVTIQIDPNQILFKNEDVEIISRLIDGNYPDYEQIIPKEFGLEVQINKGHALNAIKLVSNFSGKGNDILLKIADGKKAVEIYSSNQYLGENKYLIPAKIKGDNNGIVVFNWRYLLDGLKIMDSEEIIFGMNGESKPATIKPANNQSYFYILMPIKNS
ncbi:MAG: DNA polymerase III subunit beta [Patescibacteria group bacterium]